jgi:hypothetical protein
MKHQEEGSMHTLQKSFTCLSIVIMREYFSEDGQVKMYSTFEQPHFWWHKGLNSGHQILLGKLSTI